MKSSHVLTLLSVVVAGCGQTPAPQDVESPPDESGPSIAMLEKGRDASAAAIESLKTSLSSTEARERRDAGYALGIAANMGGKTDGLATLLAAAIKAETDSEAGVALVWALARIGKSESLPALVASLESTDSARVAAAGVALGVFGRREVALDEPTRAALVKAATSADSEVRYGASYALGREHEPPVDAAVLRTLEALALDSNAEVRAQAIGGLARRERGLERFASALVDSDWRVGVQAVRGLLALKGPRVMAALQSWATESVAKKSLHAHLARVALEGLGARADMAQAQQIASTLLSPHGGSSNLSLDDGQVVCLAAAIRVRGGGGPEALRSCGGSAVPAWWRDQLVAATVASSSRIPRSERVAQLAALAASTDARARAAAITAMADLSAGAEREQILSLYEKALADESVAVAGSAADKIGALALRGPEATAIESALVARAAKELASDGELGLTLVGSIGTNRIARGSEACATAATHRNRTIARAGADCLAALGKTSSAPAPTARSAAPAPGAKAWWRIKTSRGELVIELEPAVAPRHVAAVIKLTRAKLYDGLGFHRVVPDFVIQGGDPDGTGWGGPGFVIPAEPSHLPFERGAVGIADAGPDTGGSQWFVMHSRAPHLEGRYTRIGKVISGLEIVDLIAVGDRIVSATIEVSRPSGEASSP